MVYLAQLEEKGLTKERIAEILRFHLIESKWLREVDFEGFFKERTQELLEMIKSAMGKA